MGRGSRSNDKVDSTCGRCPVLNRPSVTGEPLSAVLKRPSSDGTAISHDSKAGSVSETDKYECVAELFCTGILKWTFYTITPRINFD